MATYAPIPDTDIDSGSPINVSLATRWSRNCEAIAEGDPTAPKIQADAIAALPPTVVGRTQLITGLEEEAGPGVKTLSASSGYGFLPQLRRNDGSFAGYWSLFGGSGVNNGVIWSEINAYGQDRIVTADTGSGEVFLRVRYISSSPPYDFGDGIVGRFVYAEVDKNGEVVASWNADDPPWYKNIARGWRVKDAAGDILILEPKSQLPYMFRDAQNDPAKMAAYVDALQGLEWHWRKLTMADKMQCCDTRPDPFDGETQDPSNRIVLLDPPSNILHRIQEAMEIDDDLSPSALLHSGYLKITDAVSRAGPVGVAVHGLKWRKK